MIIVRVIQVEHIKKYYKYYLFFLFFFLGLVFWGYNNADTIWNYGMAHAIRMGEIPYKDFNIITTPLYAFIMNFFLLFSDQYLVFLLGQSLMGTFCFYYLDKLIGKKLLFFIPFMGFLLFHILFPNYNFLVFTLVVLLIYYDKEDSNDYLIGFILGLLCLTKHTIGFVIVLCSFLSTRSWERTFQRISGMLGPGIVFLIYLLCTGSFSSFWNLSILGLFDFGGDNHFLNTPLLVFSMLIMIYCLWYIWKRPKDSSAYYLLGSISMMIPIIDLFHFQYLLLLFVLHFLIHTDEIHKYVWGLGIALSIFFLGFNLFSHYPHYQMNRFSTFKRFTGYLVPIEREKKLTKVLKDYQERENAYMFSYSNMFLDIVSDHEITYFDIPLYGNFGYDGVTQMKKKIDGMHDVYFYVQDHENIQYCKDLYRYIKEKSKKSYEIEDFEVYYKE